MQTPICELFSPTVLIAIGIVLVALEALLLSFFIFWFGIATVIVGISSYFITYSNGLWQLASIAILALVLLTMLRTKAIGLLMKAQGRDHDDDFFNESGEGIIKEGRVYFKGTYWKIDASQKFKNNEKVRVTGTKGSVAFVEKLQ